MGRDFWYKVSSLPGSTRGPGMHCMLGFFRGQSEPKAGVAGGLWPLAVEPKRGRPERTCMRAAGERKRVRSERTTARDDCRGTAARMPPRAWRNVARCHRMPDAIAAAESRDRIWRRPRSGIPPAAADAGAERRAAWMRTDAEPGRRPMPGRMPDKTLRHGCRTPLRGSGLGLGRPTGRAKRARTLAADPARAQRRRGSAYGGGAGCTLWLRFAGSWVLCGGGWVGRFSFLASCEFAAAGA